MNKKILAFILVCLMTVSVLAACGEKKLPQASDTLPASDASEYSEIDAYVDMLASDVNFDGETFTILGKGSEHCADEEVTGNLENDALYSRMREIEEKFGITYKFVAANSENYDSPSVEVTAKVESDVMSGTGAYDAAQSNIMVGSQVMLSKGLLQPVEELPGIDLVQDWWLNDIEAQFGIGGHLFFLTGKLVTDHYIDPSSILFNKKIAEDFNIEGLYDIVIAGEWTMDKFVEVTSVIPNDGSIYKMVVGNYEDGLAFYFAGGFSLCDVDEDGNLTLPTAIGNAEADWIDKLAGIFGDSKSYFVEERDDESNGPSSEFIDGKVFSVMDAMGGVSRFRKEDIEFGILPLPKRDLDQEEYISYSHSMSVASYTVSKVAPNVEKTGVILEAMAALSEKYLEPAYYDKALKGRGTYDTESRAMLDIIYNGKKVDYATTYQWGDVWRIIDDAITGVTDSYISNYTSGARIGNLRVKQLVGQIKSEYK